MGDNLSPQTGMRMGDSSPALYAEVSQQELIHRRYDEIHQTPREFWTLDGVKMGQIRQSALGANFQPIESSLRSCMKKRRDPLSSVRDEFVCCAFKLTLKNEKKGVDPHGHVCAACCCALTMKVTQTVDLTSY